MAAAKLTTEWKAAILQSLKKNRSLAYARYFQVATIRPDGRPSNRTVVFRGFVEDTDLLAFITDSRSTKIEDIAHSPFAEICWYLPSSREQYRLSGRLQVVRADSDPSAPPAAAMAAAAAAEVSASAMAAGRQKIWDGMSDPGRAQFMWPDPGQPRTLPRGAWDDVQPPAAGGVPPPDTFCMVAMDVERVDHLLLPSNRRFKYTRGAGAARQGGEGGAAAGGWEKQEVNP